MATNWTVISVIFAVRLLCARYSLIPDCDEVFNYWEPLHYLTHGSGRQTWEYSPDYAIRSWLYEALHAIPIRAAMLLGLQNHQLFFALRSFFALASAYTEARLYESLTANISRNVARWYVIFSVLSTGMFHASISFLPSSFAMHAFTLALAEFLGMAQARRRHSSIVKGIAWTAAGGLLGWPFVLALAIPFGLAYLVQSLATSEYSKLVRSVLQSAAVVSGILGAIIAFDSAAYEKFVVVPANIVLYNVINADESSGPNIFGTEPWWYYPLNLSMNFNGIFVLSVAAVVSPLLPLVGIKCTRKHLALSLLPFYVWLAIFIVQPHKEERFMYVVYQSICLNAAVAFESIAQLAAKLHLNRRIFATASLSLILTVSLSRTLALTFFYEAPLTVYSVIPSLPEGNICVGREWYRYPSSYFLNDAQRLNFIKSGFTGLLPGSFEEAHWPAATHIVPEGMNNQNLEDPGKYVPISSCDYVVDISGPVDELIETQFTSSSDWKKVHCAPFLNNGESRGLGRILYLPEFLQKLTKTQLVYDDYCILERADQN